MPINLDEEILTFGQAARRLPKLRNECPVSPVTLWRWATCGIRGVRLETIKVGSRNCTTFEALERFLMAINSRPKKVSMERRGERRRQHNVETELEKLGIK